MTTNNKTTFHDIDYGMGKKTAKVYLLGFIACLILTFIPFLSVIHVVASKTTLMWIIFISAVLQFFVQVICFLRMNFSNQQAKVNTLSFIFSGVVLLVIIGGSLWIMTSLNYFMMH